MVFLELKFNDEITQVVVEQELVTIGRSKSCTYSVSDSNLSSKHCQLYVKDNFLFIEDLDSKNGITLNGIKITKEKIYLSDVLNIGAVTLSIDRLKLDPDSIEILTAPASDDRNLNIELASPVNKLKIESKVNTKNAFQIKSKNISKKDVLKAKIISVFKFVAIIVIFLVIYKLLR